MTVISQSIDDITIADNNTVFEFSAPAVRDSANDTALITTRPVRFTAVNGVLTTTNLDPGPAMVRIGLKIFYITIPDSPTPVRLWPLIEASLPVAPPLSLAVHNGGNATRIQVLTASQYAALVSSTTPDPGSIFLVY